MRLDPPLAATGRDLTPAPEQAAPMSENKIYPKLVSSNGSAVAPPPSPQILICSKCGAQAEANCMCAAPYLPAGKRAAEAIKASPGLSDRAIADKIGVSNQTV